MKTIIVQGNKILKLKNVLICELYNTIVDIDGDLINSQDNTLEMLVVQMTNQIKSKGSNVVGPLIQYSGMKVEDDDVGLSISLMIQANNYIKNLDPGYKMESVIKVSNCMYVRFVGREEDLQIAYKKIEVEAYENEIELRGDSYTIFVDSNEETGEITADIFMEKA